MSPDTPYYESLLTFLCLIYQAHTALMLASTNMKNIYI